MHIEVKSMCFIWSCQH